MSRVIESMFLSAGPDTGTAQPAAEAAPATMLDVGEDAAQGAGTPAAERLSALGQMTGGIAHDFRNILAVIRSSLNLIEQNEGNPQMVSSCLAAAQEGIERGLRLTSRLVRFASQQEQKPQLANVNDLLLEMAAFLKYSVGSEIAVQLELAPGLPNCLIDPSQFCSAILNLVVNARDAIPARGTIKVSTGVGELAPDEDAGKLCEACVHVRVEDNGTGMSPDVLRRIFERYFTTKGATGTGLGLPQVCAFVRQVERRIDVSSIVGRGTTFDLAIPAATPAAIPGHPGDSGRA